MVTRWVPAANFTATPQSGYQPMTVTFHDTSTNAPTSWGWNFWDGTPPVTTQNPVHIYLLAGNYTVSLIATNGIGTDTETKVHYIHVSSDAIIDTYEDNILKYAYRQPTSFKRIVRKNLRALYIAQVGPIIDTVLVNKYMHIIRRMFAKWYSYLKDDLRWALEDFVTEGLTP